MKLQYVLKITLTNSKGVKESMLKKKTDDYVSLMTEMLPRFAKKIFLRKVLVRTLGFLFSHIKK